MKIVICFLFSVMMNLGFSQTVYNGFLSKTDFQYLLNDGLTYIKTGDEATDNIVINSLEKHWTFTSIKIEEPDAWNRISDTTTLFLVSIGRVFVLPSSALMGEKKIFTIQSSFVSMRFGGFCNGIESDYFFLDHMVATVNKVIEFEANRFKGKTDQEIKDMRWEAYASSCTSQFRKHLLPSTAKIIKEKTMLFIEGNADYVNPKVMEEFALNYKIMTFNDYKKLSSEELLEYTLFYFAPSWPGEDNWNLLILDLKDYSPLFFNNNVDIKKKFSKSDIEMMLPYW